MAELQRAAEALHESEERLRIMADFASDWEYWIGPDGRFLYVSPACEGITGYSALELLADNGLMARLIHPADIVSFREHMHRVMGGSSDTCLMDVRIVCRDGMERWIEHSCRSVYRSDGEWWGRRGCNRDITERKRAEAELARFSAELRGLAAHLQTAREEERRKIATRIHDDLGQSLTALKMDAAWLERRLPRSAEDLIEKARGMSDLIGGTLRAIQRLSLDLRPRLLDDLGLPAALEWQRDDFARHTGLACSLQVRPEEMTLSRDVAVALFRIAQEALANVARHAGASRVMIALEQRGDSVVLEVADDGRGIDEAALRDVKAFGLMQMRERALACNGELTIEGRAGSGTTVRVRLSPENALVKR